ncbi:iron(III) transport system ATP-binding protein [Solibacillus kalamii]|uniref:Spermidine/putrescine ABC transporter ATP-binding protein n=1 Tax=Solibacillus kalamii TaxID=1748298 RepID=A0ABX3ZDB1_9BACL|nr:ABC transporter ATP-binding protein [Solibacillus kalamii]MBM7666795.1 iron(III) transport system ATP-binding protein [Solibacillus kalamii]OUZ37691.1 spermidine/putrescine ABC transporter ATP-binding protein [Solibacillus kalamii]
MKAVHINDVSKKFGDVVSVKDLELDIKSGEFFTFLGPSGCGKTTTLRMIAGFYYPSKGKIYFDNQDVTTLQPNKRNIGMVFQNYALFPHMTVNENIAFGLEIRKYDKKTIKEKVDRIRELVHLGPYGTRKINELSGGQQQRVALARALVIEPDILLLDEPLSNLDAKLREETRIEIKRIQSELGVTTIYVTHDQTEAMAMSDRIMVMEHGVVKQIGTPQEIYHRPNNRFVATFIGETNLLTMKVQSIEDNIITVTNDNGLVLQGLTENLAPGLQVSNGDEIFISIRPEAFESGPGENTVTGIVELIEFTGVSVNYFIKWNDTTLKAMIISRGTAILQAGDMIELHIPKQNIYFLGE